MRTRFKLKVPEPNAQPTDAGGAPLQLLFSARLWRVLVVVIVVGAVSVGCNAPTPTLSAEAALNTVNAPWLETSVGVDAVGNDQRIFVFGFGQGLSVKISDLATNPAPISTANLPPANMQDTTHWANDQLTVQLANGDVLLAWNGASRIADANLASSAAWWDTWPTADGKAPSPYPPGSKRDGLRPAILLWRWSSANDSWNAGSSLDAAYAGGVAADGTVHKDQCAQGVPWVKGFDRPELYADPWGVKPDDIAHQRLYLTTSCSRPDGDDAEQVYVSPDSGTSWTGHLRLPNGHTVLTASPSGRLFMVQYGADDTGNGTPVLWWSDDQGASLASATPIGAPFDVGYHTAKERFPAAVLQCSDTGAGPPWIYPLAIGAAGPSAIFVAYPSVETATVDGRSVKRQVLAVTLVLVPMKPDAVPMVLPVGVIRAKAPSGSVIMSSMITDSRGVGNPASLLYWMETAGRPKSPCVDPVTVSARYALLGVQSPLMSDPADLSDPAGFALHMPSPVDPTNWSFGDYMKGSSYYDAAAKQLRFIPVWSQEDPGGAFGAPGAMRPHLRIASIDAPPAGTGSDSLTNLMGSPQAKPAVRARPVTGKTEPLDRERERPINP